MNKWINQERKKEGKKERNKKRQKERTSFPCLPLSVQSPPIQKLSF